MTTHTDRYAIGLATDRSSVGFQGSVSLVPVWLVQTFGLPKTRREFSTGDYTFVDHADNGYTLYDGPAAHVWDGCDWTSTVPYRFSIGAPNRPLAVGFIHWLETLADEARKAA